MASVTQILTEIELGAPATPEQLSLEEMPTIDNDYRHHAAEATWFKQA